MIRAAAPRSASATRSAREGQILCGKPAPASTSAEFLASLPSGAKIRTRCSESAAQGFIGFKNLVRVARERGDTGEDTMKVDERLPYRDPRAGEAVLADGVFMAPTALLGDGNGFLNAALRFKEAEENDRISEVGKIDRG